MAYETDEKFTPTFPSHSGRQAFDPPHGGDKRMIRSTKRTAALYIASIAVAAAQPGFAHAQERPESSLNALFPVADHAAVDPGRRPEVRTDPATFSVDPGLGSQLVDNDPDAGTVFARTALGSAVGYLGGFFFLSKACWTNCSETGGGIYWIATAASVVGLPALGAHLGGGDGRWALLGSAVGAVSGLYIASILEGKAGFVFFIGIHVTATALFALI